MNPLDDPRIVAALRLPVHARFLAAVEQGLTDIHGGELTARQVGDFLIIRRLKEDT